MDSNIKFLVKASECHLGVSFLEENWDKDNVPDFEAISNFINDDKLTVLYAFVENDGKKLRFVLDLELIESRVVVFTKIHPISGDNLINSLQVTSFVGSPILALYQTLHNVFTPLLAKKCPVNIQRQVANLQADLRSDLLSSGDDDSVSVQINSVLLVESLEHEIEYWGQTSRTHSNRQTRQSALIFKETLGNISKDLSVLDAMPLTEVEDVLENAHGVLDDLWRHEQFHFPKERMAHLMDLIGEEVKKCVCKQIQGTDLWGDNYSTISELLNQCIGISDRWLSSCQQLTQIFWPNYTSHVWKQPPYQPEELSKLVNRLKEVLTVQTLLRQLTRLLTPQEQATLKTNDMFKPFKELNCLEFGQYSANLWLKACKQFEYSLEPAEERVGVKLKQQLSGVNPNTRQLLHDFSRYSELINRPILKQNLLPERINLLKCLYEYVGQLQNTESKLVTKVDTSQIIADVITNRQLEAKIGEVIKTAEKLLGDLQGYDSLMALTTEISRDLKTQQSELFESWTSEIMSMIKSDELTLKESDPVVQFSKQTQLMKVNYSPRLVALISEVRQFKALNYHVPSEIEQISEHAKKFMVLARTLEQIANFHNTIGDRMITCQRPMMLNSALELSRLVQQEEVVSWGDTKSVEKYVENLKNCVGKLSKECNLLTAYNSQLVDKIKQLEDVDLIRDYNKWKEISREMRGLITQVEEKGFKNMHAWKIDIDTQLAKVLEKQYLRSLDSLHLYLPVIYTDVVYRNSQLQFSPNEENLREKYHQQLKKFLDIPKTFRGVAEYQEASIFAEIIDRSNLEKVTKHTEDLFEQLKGVLTHWQSWLQLESLDVSKLSQWQHWDLHFRASKTFGQEIAKLPSTEERVGCFFIGLTRLRADLESHNRSYWDQLVESLKDSIAQDVVKLQNYVDRSTGVLTKQPVTLEEIGESGAAHANILKQITEMEETYTQMTQKSQILSSWNREQIDSAIRLKGAWERLQNLLENHQHIIAKQMSTIKTTLLIESENLDKEMERFGAKWEQIKPKPHTGQILNQSMDELFKQFMDIQEKKEQFTELVGKRSKLLEDYERYDLKEIPEFPLFTEIELDLIKECETWTLFQSFHSELEAMCNEEWIVFRKKIYQLEDFVTSWREKLSGLQDNDLATRILHELHKYEGAMPCLKFVRGEDFTGQHWIDVFGILHLTLKPLEMITLKDFLNVSEKLSQHSKELQAICKKAASEIVVRQAFAELDQWDVQAKFVLTPHKNSQHKDLMLIKDFKEILSKIGDNQSLLQSVQNSVDYNSFSDRANMWEEKLATLEQNLTVLAQIQRKWVYLEPIFGGGTLIQEKTRFEKIDRDFQHVLNFIEKDTRVSSLLRYNNLKSVLSNVQEQLARCQKSLENFLLEKREKFPRFLFLGDDDLLEVVGQSSKEQVIQTHLKKLFSGIHSIQLDPEGTRIIAMRSSEGEVVTLKNPVNIQKPVEDWLNALVKEMQATLKELLVECLRKGQSVDPLHFPSQILCLADSITFTQKTEEALQKTTVPPLLAYYKAQLAHYSSLELSRDQNLDEVLELKLKSLLLDTIHHVDVLQQLLADNVRSVGDWQWQKQLRFYSNSVGEVTVKMANARMDYSYEYLGNPQKLVRTPLTDRCFLTLTQGMHLGMGGNPNGPAGTGKTESVKALAGFLGRQVLVFNCDEAIDSSSMGRILTGLVRSGAWGCFDEFNRLDEATLSAVSMQIQPIQEALRNKNAKLVLLDREIVLDRHCGIFVTLNPAGGGYGGRNKLPDNLKQLFRPVVMTQPDHQQIARTLLHCDGFQNADSIAKKLMEIFNASAKLLGKQQHYDWGLRAIRTVLGSCGSSLKQFRRNTKPLDLSAELEVVLKVLRMDTLSKLTFEDSVKFEQLLKDVFKDVIVDEIGDELLVKALEECCADFNIEKNDKQIAKCVELNEQLKQRMGVALVGPPSCGKTTVRNLLFHALNKLGTVVKQHVFNPKSMTKNELLGFVDLDTRQWNDGVLTKHSLEVTSDTENWSWIVCDGNIDPEWVESLNSVLDDNRLLSLPSGWRIQFGRNVNFLFETHDLSNASPATISRMGIVLLSDHDLDLEQFIRKQSENYPLVANYIEDFLPRCVKWSMDECELAIETSKVAIARTGLSLLDGVTDKSEFTVAIVHGLGQQLQADFGEPFAQQVYNWLDELPPPNILKSRYNPERNSIEAYYTNPNVVVENASRRVPLVLTGDVAKTIDDLSIWLRPGNEQHFLLIGPHGSAKTLLLEHLVSQRSDMEMATVYCSANLTPTYLISKFSQLCIMVNTNIGRVFKPKRGNLVLHLKNLHLLKPDKWGTNILIEFLHQMITYKAFYSNLELIGFENITIVGSLNLVNTLSARFTSILNIYNVNLPEDDDLSIIIVAYLTALLKTNNNSWPKTKITKLASTLIGIYQQISSVFTQNEQKHYDFSPHDLAKLTSSILRYKTLESDELFQVFAYEIQREFGDKLVDNEDRKKLQKIVDEQFKSYWSISNITSSIRDLYYVPISEYSSTFNEEIALEKLTKNEWESVVSKGRTQYEREAQHLDLVINIEILELAASLSRILSSFDGHAVLVGRAGIGRKSALKIVSALQSAKIVTPTQVHLNNDLKTAMQIAGLDGDHVYLLLEDHFLAKSDVLNAANMLISAGEVPGIYNQSELESVTAGLKDEASRENFEGCLVDFFRERVRKRLHVVACVDVDNVGEVFQNCPGFLHKSGIIWQVSWCSQSIQDISTALINQSSADHSQHFPKLYEIASEQIPSPYRYIAMIKAYIAVFTQKKTHIEHQQSKLKLGVAKLQEAADLVTQLKEQAAEKQIKLAEKQSKANAALDMISNTMRNANTHKEEMQVLKHKTEEENQLLITRKSAIEQELTEVEPLMQEARAAVGNIKPEALSEIRSLRAPPEVIRDILEGVLRLMGIQDTSWNSMKTFLAKRGVKEEIRCFDAGRITAESRQAVEKLMNSKGDSFDSKAAKRASIAAAPLAAWVAANVKYSHVMDKIKPLEREQNRLQHNLDNAQAQLGELSAGLSDVDETVAKLKLQLAAYTKEAAEIEIDLNKAQETLKAAEGLVSKLDDEYQRWKEQLKELSKELEALPNNCSLAAAFIAYLSDESEAQRQIFLSKCMKEIRIDQFHFEQFMSNEREQLQWHSEGLSNDQTSIQNAIIMLNSNIVPLVIDSTSNATIWYKSRYKQRSIESVTQNDPKFSNILELAVRFGKILIVEEVEQISPILLPILRQEFTVQGERKLIKLNEKLVDFHSDFQLILSSRNEHLQIGPDFNALVSTMNFRITHSGLCEKLLSSAIRQEKPQLEERRKQLLREREELQESQHQLQNQLLEDLANSEGDILQNTNLIASLNKTKASSVQICLSLVELVQVQAKLREECEVYKDISWFGSSLYFACNEFSKANVLYVLSVSACIKLFLTSLRTYQDLGMKQLEKQHLFEIFYAFCARGIFKTDRITFAMHLIRKLFLSDAVMEWSILMGVSSRSADSENLPSWIPKQSLQNLANLQVSLPDFYVSLRLNEPFLWDSFMSADKCEQQFPTHCKLTPLQKVLAVQALRPDRLYSTMSQLFTEITGLNSIDPSVFSLSQIAKESTCCEPILILTVSGSDPSEEIRQLANQNDFVEVAMGEGQEVKALALVQKTSQNGQWLVLKNLHLVTSWLAILSQTVQTLKPHKNFRLWMITEPNAAFNFVLAQNSLKIVYETPQGVRNNLQRTFTSWGSYLEKLSVNSARIFFVLAHVNALLQERRTYIPQGWSKWYEFGDSDFATCVKLMEDLWQHGSGSIQWKFIKGLCLDAVYGGRIECVGDLRILEAYLRQFFVDDVLSYKWTPFNVHLPNTSKFYDFLNMLRQLPERDSPSYFGLPENIDRAWEKQTSRNILKQLRNLHLNRKITLTFERDVWHRETASFMNLWKKINQGFDFIRMSLAPHETSSPISDFIAEDFRSAVELIQTIHKDFSMLNRLCKGTIVPDENGLNVGQSLLNFEVPLSWKTMWHGPKDPVKYLRSLVGKTQRLQNIQEEVGHMDSKAFSLSSFLHPDAFLTAYKQEFSRANNISMDQLALETHWKRPSQKNYITLTDLLIEGALYDGVNLKTCTAQSENINSAPDCYISWTSGVTKERLMDVPLYNNSEREKQLVCLQIQCEQAKEKDKWIQAGLAFYLEL